MEAQQFRNGFISAFTLILASELGDKTFLTTSIFSLEYPRLVVFLSSMIALTVMNFFSILLGALTTQIPQYIIHYVSVMLFLFFGSKMIIEGYKMPQEETIDDEMKKVEKIILKKEKDSEKKISSPWSDYSLVFMKIFSLIFLAEWGDKSQLSTILLAAKEGIWAVGLGTFCANFVTNGIAVLFSKIISHFISVRTIQIMGGTIYVGCSLMKIFS